MQVRRNQQLAQRRLLLPIISEGYASTNFQGGPVRHVEEDDDDVTTTTTTAATTTRRRTTTTTEPPPIIETFVSEDVPATLPQAVIDEYLLERHRPNRPFRQSLPVAVVPRPREPTQQTRHYFTTRRPFRAPVDTAAAVPVRDFAPVPNFAPVPIPIPTGAPEPPPIRDFLSEETGRPLELYTGELITADNPEEDGGNADGPRPLLLLGAEAARQPRIAG